MIHDAYHRRKDPERADPRRKAERKFARHSRKCARSRKAAAGIHDYAVKQRRAYQRWREHEKLRETSRCGTPICNRALAQVELPVSGQEWACLDSLWFHESNWEETARNSSSGAYGIPQALPASKMGSAAQGSGWQAALAQVRWGWSYITGRYGSACGAWSYWQSAGWY